MFQSNLAEKIKTHFIFNNFFFENCAVCDLLWKNIVEPGRPQMTKWSMRIYTGYHMQRTNTQNTQYLMLFHITNVSQVRFFVRLYVHGQSCYFKHGKMHKIWTADYCKCDWLLLASILRSSKLYLPSRCTNTEIAIVTVMQEVGLEDVEKRKLSGTCKESNSYSLVVQFVSQWSYWGIPAREAKCSAINTWTNDNEIFRALVNLSCPYISFVWRPMFSPRSVSYFAGRRKLCAVLHDTSALCQLSNTVSTNKCSTWFKPLISCPF
jgi:hypothetical protein